MAHPLLTLVFSPPSADDSRSGASSWEDRHSVASGNHVGAEAQALVERIRLGDEEAFLEIYRAYYAGLCTFANGYLHDAARAEDVVSDVFLQIWRARGELRVTGTVRAYLFSAIRYRVLNARRDDRRRFERQTVGTAIGESLGMGEMGEGPTVLAADRDVGRSLEALWQAVAELPERGRLVMTLRWREEMSLSEIAAVLGVTEMAVRQLHKRALAALRERLAGIFE